MRSYNANEFVAYVSRISDQAFIVASIDPAHLSDPENGEQVYDVLCEVLDEKTAETISTCCGANIILPTLSEAYQILADLSKVMTRMPGAGLIATIYVGGHVFHEIRQEGAFDPEMPLAQTASVM